MREWKSQGDVSQIMQKEKSADHEKLQNIKRLSIKGLFQSSYDIKLELSLPFCERTVRRRLKGEHLFGRSPREVSLLTRRHRTSELGRPRKLKQKHGEIFSGRTRVR